MNSWGQYHVLANKIEEMIVTVLKTFISFAFARAANSSWAGIIKIAIRPQSIVARNGLSSSKVEVIEPSSQPPKMIAAVKRIAIKIPKINLYLSIMSLLCFNRTESSCTICVSYDSFFEVLFSKVGPICLGDIEFRVRYLPQQEVADSFFVCGTNQEVRIM